MYILKTSCITLKAGSTASHNTRDILKQNIKMELAQRASYFGFYAIMKTTLIVNFSGDLWRRNCS